MSIHPLIPEDYPVIDSYMQELHDASCSGTPDLFIPAVTFIRSRLQMK